MGIASFPTVHGGIDVADLANIVAILIKEVDFLQTSLDSKNVREIAGYNVSQTTLQSRNGVVGLSSAKSGGDDVRIWAGDTDQAVAAFQVYESGKMVASNAEITGKVTANSGKIGGWVIGADSLKDSSGMVGMNSAVTGGDDVRFFAGSSDPSSAPYRVNKSGAVFASNISITGGSINVDTNATIGNKLFLSSSNFGNGIQWGASSMEIYIDPAAQAMHLQAFGGIYANGIRIDVVPPPA